MADSLLAGAVLGLSVAAPFGPVSLVCVQQSLNRGYRYGLLAGFGAATAHGVFATTAIAGAGVVSMVLTPWAGAIRLVSAAVLVGIGIRTIMRARSAAAPSRNRSLGAAYGSSLMLALSNPMTILPYLALATVAAGSSVGGAALSLWSIPGVVLAAATWYAGLSLVSAALRRGLAPGTARVLNLVAGGLLIGFGAIVGRDVITVIAEVAR